jgi:glycerol-3-phosphate dehydrogenase subunit B
MCDVEGARENGRVTAVYTATIVRKLRHRACHFVLATGGILGGGFLSDYQGHVQEVVFDLPVKAPENHTEWFHRDFFDERGHPIYRAGIAVNENFQPVDRQAHLLYENLYCAGTTLAHAEVVRERSFEGVAIGTGFAAAEMLNGAEMRSSTSRID